MARKMMSETPTIIPLLISNNWNIFNRRDIFPFLVSDLIFWSYHENEL